MEDAKKSAGRIVLESLSIPLYKIYSSTSRKWHYRGLDLVVNPKIFHPGWFVTSKMLLEKLESTPVSGKSFLELGCGSGVQACRAAQLGALSFASDITHNACNNVTVNAQRNKLDVVVIQSDIFEEMAPEFTFDFIFVNPPFLPHYPEMESDFAFFCGEEFEYFQYLFEKLDRFLNPKGELIMALAKSCEVKYILEIADYFGFHSERIFTKVKWAETNFLYKFTFNSEEP